MTEMNEEEQDKWWDELVKNNELFKNERVDRYVLVDRKPVPEPHLLKWGRFMEKADRIVGKTQVGIYEVSTCFLGLDPNFGRGKLPVLFETMVFGGERTRTLELGDKVHVFDGPESIDDEGDWFNRYCTWEEAEQGHAAIVRLVKGRIANTLKRGQEELGDVNARRAGSEGRE